MAAPGKGVVLAVGAAAAAGYSLYLLLRWRKYRVLFEPVYTAEGVPAAKRVVTKVKFGKVGTENRGTNPMDPPIEKDDDLFWMRDDKRKDHSVIAHLNRENAYFEHKFAPLRSLQATLYKEFVSHTKETDEEVPYPHGPYVYYTRTVKGLSYPIHCRKSRKAGTSEAVGAEEIVLDHNVLAKGKAHCDVQQWEMSPDRKLVASAAYAYLTPSTLSSVALLGDASMVMLARENIVLKNQLQAASLELTRLRSMCDKYQNDAEGSVDSKNQPRYWTDEEQRFLDAIQKFGHKDVKVTIAGSCTVASAAAEPTAPGSTMAAPDLFGRRKPRPRQKLPMWVRPASTSSGLASGQHEQSASESVTVTLSSEEWTSESEEEASTACRGHGTRIDRD